MACRYDLPFAIRKSETPIRILSDRGWLSSLAMNMIAERSERRSKKWPFVPQYSEGRSTVVTERSASVMIQNFSVLADL